MHLCIDLVGLDGLKYLVGYENHTTALFRSLLKPGMRVVDAGAFIGYYTLLSASIVGPTGQVYAFEPDPRALLALERNVQLNRLSNITVVPAALSDTSGSGILAMGPQGGTSSLYHAPTVVKRRLKVDLFSLDDFMAHIGFPPIHLVKMDIEGGEHQALLGAREVIRRNPHVKLIFEFKPTALRCAGRDPFEFLVFLREMGFSVWEIDEHGGQLQLLSNPVPLLRRATRDRGFSVNLLAELKQGNAQ